MLPAYFRFSVLLLFCLSVQSFGADLRLADREEKLEAGQAFFIEVPLDSESIIAGGYAIDSAGFADLPIVGRVYVHGLKQVEVENYLARRLVDYLKDTHIKVTPAYRLAMLGHWTLPGMYYVDRKATVWEALKISGGPAGEKNLEKLHVMRDGERLEIDVLGPFAQGKSLASAGIQSGDIFIIPIPDDRGFWYWFRETLGITGDVIGIAGSIITIYLTTEFILERNL